MQLSRCNLWDLVVFLVGHGNMAYVSWTWGRRVVNSHDQIGKALAVAYAIAVYICLKHPEIILDHPMILRITYHIPAFFI